MKRHGLQTTIGVQVSQDRADNADCFAKLDLDEEDDMFPSAKVIVMQKVCKK
jgi:hypothetical protein